jgi:hypothetical protein
MDNRQKGKTPLRKDDLHLFLRSDCDVRLKVAKICSNRGSSSSARQGKRDKYHYEAECVTDVPIGCILNR